MATHEIPTVAIVGRPNVGKSSLLNAFVKKKVSIVDPTPGVTRDRVSVLVEHKDYTFEMVDTGGVGIVDMQDLSDDVEEQIRFALDNAQVILFVVNIRDGVLPLDKTVARLLRKLKDVEDRVIVVANKADVEKFEDLVGEFYKLGLGEITPVSAHQQVNIHRTLDLITERLPKVMVERDLSELKIALVGKRNAGKSTLTNLLAGEERVIVSDIPGTTRDAVDVRFSFRGMPCVVIDTAGMRRKSSMEHPVDLYSQGRSERSIRRADVCVLMINAAEEISIVDKKLADFIAHECKPCIVCINKWDLAKDHSTESYINYISEKLPFLHYAPITFISATENLNINDTLKIALDLHQQSQIRIGTGPLNKTLQAASKQNSPRVRKVSKVPKIFYATQVDIAPPTFIIFVNDPALFDDQYRRYLEGSFRNDFDFKEIPLRLYFRGRERTDLPPKRNKPGKLGRDIS